MQNVLFNQQITNGTDSAEITATFSSTNDDGTFLSEGNIRMNNREGIELKFKKTDPDGDKSKNCDVTILLRDRIAIIVEDVAFEFTAENIKKLNEIMPALK